MNETIEQRKTRVDVTKSNRNLVDRVEKSAANGKNQSVEMNRRNNNSLSNAF